jgi:hypothetical protein
MYHYGTRDNHAQANRQPYSCRRRTAVSHENEKDALTYLLVWAVYFMDSASRKAIILGAKAKGAWRTSSFALECESELEERGAALHVSSDQETWRPGITQTQGSKPLSLCIVSKHVALQISAVAAQGLGLLSLITVDTRTTLRGRILKQRDYQEKSRGRQILMDLSGCRTHVSAERAE